MNYKFKSTYEIVKENTGLSLNIEKDLEKWIDFYDVKEIIKENMHLGSEIKKLKRKLEYQEWKRIMDRRKNDALR